MDIITQQAIIQTCQNSLLAYSSFTNKNYSIQPHHRVIAQVLQEVEQGKRKKVMFFMPPRFGKSEIASINFPAWYLGRNPENALLLCSYGADLANEFSRKARNRFASTEHGIIFDSRLASDSASASEWHTDKGGGMASAGVDGAITGKGGHCLAKGTKIDTINGIREIQDIQSGDFVLSYNHTTNEQEYKRVIATRTSTTRRMYTLTATSGRVIKTTREHEIFIIGQGYKEMVKCKKNESIIIHKSTSYLLGLFSGIREACLGNTKGLKDWYKTIFLQSSVSVSSFLMTQMQKMQNKFSRTSQEFESKKQGGVKSNNGLQTLSYHPSQVESDSISSIISIETDETVYDIEVESNNNLFANGILVHNCLITDDPVKNQLEADSPLKRQRTWDWYNSDFRSRKMDDQSAEIVMLTRWHMDDLAGRLLAAEDDWYVVKVPALRKNGESNWPERFSSEYFETVKKQGGPRIWASLYMQDPKPLGGGLFKREYFKYYSQMQLDTRALDITKMQRYTFMDPAISMKQTADYTTIVTIGILNGDIYILDIVRERMEPDRAIGQLFEVVKMYNPAIVGVESVAFQKMLIQEIRKHMETRGQSFVLDEIHPMGEKEARISATLHSSYITGKVYHLHGGENVLELEDELLSFPLGTHDDIIDALSGAVKMSGNSVAALWKGGVSQSYILPNITQR